MRAHHIGHIRFSVGIVGFGLSLALVLWAPPAAAQVACSNNGNCASGEACIAGECRLACMTDADCAGGTLCLRGGCFPGATVTAPIDYGLTSGADVPASCDDDAQCTPTFQCNPAQRCQLLQGGNPITCEDGVGGNTSARCPPFPGWSCNAGVCQGPSCATGGVADCQTAFPIAQLQCLNGRCSTACTPANAATTCCTGAGRRCDTRPQNKCFQWDTGEAGVCIRGTGFARLYAVRLGSTDLTAAQNIVFVSERFTGTDALSSFGEQALRHLRWLATHADGTNAILSARHNLFVLEVDNPNDWGRYISSINSIQDRRGATSQGTFLVATALTQFSATIGTPRTRAAISTVTKAVFLDNLEICVDIPSPFGTWPLPGSPPFPIGGLPGPFPRCFPPNVRATGGSRIVLDVAASIIPGFNLTLDDQISDTYDVMQHEFGHFLARITDEYDNDSPGELRPFDFFNTVSRHTVSNCDPTFDPNDDTSPFDKTLCEGSDDGTFTAANACWGPFINASLPSSGGDQRDVGLFPGGERVFPRKAMRSQARCIMRQNGSDVFCAACREELMRFQIPNGQSQAFRFLDLSGGIQPPAANGLGPIRGVTVSPTLKRTFVTREEPTSGDAILTVIDTDALTVLATRNLDLPRQNAALPQNIVVDEAGSRLALPSYDLAMPANSGVILFDATQSFVSPLPASAFQSIVVPFLVSVPVLSGRNLLAYRERPEGPLGFTGELVTLDLTATTPAPQFTIPTTRGPLPHLIPTPLVAPAANLIFFPAAPFPGDPYCDAPSCEIWIFDPATSAFLDQALVLDTAGATSPGIRLATLANAGVTGERLVVATETNLAVFSTASIRAGTFTPEFEGPHGIAGPGSSLAAIAYVPDTNQVLIGAKTGELSLMPALTANPGATRQVLTIPGATADMEVRDVLVSDNTAYVAMAGFAPAPRAGLIAVLDLARAGADRSAFVQPTAATGLTLPALAIDRDRGVLYSNAIVDSRDRIRNNPMRSPLIRTLRAPPVPTGCP